MKLEDLRPGLYRIARDTKNPKPDRRVTRDWRAESVFPAGGVVSIVFQDVSHMIEGDETARIIEAKPYGDLSGSNVPSANALPLGAVTKKRGPHLKDDPRVPVLLEALEPHEPRNVDEALRMFNDAGNGTLAWRDIAIALMIGSPLTTAEVFRLSAALTSSDDSTEAIQRRSGELAKQALKVLR